MRLKKLAVFILVFTAVCGIVAVDEAYSDMMDQEGKIVPQAVRVDEDLVSFSMFGQTAVINVTELENDWNGVSIKVADRLDTAVTHIQSFLGIKEEERDYSVFHTQIL
jgi:hypothetical protein